MNKIKGLKLRYFLGFLVIIYCFTALSHFIEYQTLPQVKLASTTSGRLSLDFKEEASVTIKSKDVMYASVQGIVSDVTVQEGSHVKKDEPLLQYDVQTLNEEVAKLEEEIGHLKRDLEISNLRLEGAKSSSIQHVYNKYQNNLKLYDNGVISEKDLQESLRAYNDALKNQQVSEKEYLKSIEELNDRLMEKEVSLTSIKHLIKNEGYQYARENGVISQINISVGQKVQKDEMLLQYESNESLRHVEVSIDEQIAKFYESGDQVQIESPTEEMKIEGEITQIKRDESNENKRKLSIIIDHPLQSSQLVTVYGSKQSKKYPVIVPNHTIVTEDNNHFVWLIKEVDGKSYLSKSAVVIGDKDDRITVIENGLNAKDEFVVSVINEKSLSNNQQIKVVE